MRRIFSVWAAAMITSAWPALAQTPAQLLQQPPSANLRGDLASWGDAAVDPILTAVRSETGASPVRLGILLHALRDIATPAGERALRSLLEDQRPHVRGTVAKLLAERNARCSVPALSNHISDTAEYEKVRQGDAVMSVSVGSAVTAVLTELTGVHLSGSLSDRHALLTAWWQAQSALQCGGTR